MPASPTEQSGAPSPGDALGTCYRCMARMLDRLERLAAEFDSSLHEAPPADAADRAGALVADIDEALAVHMGDEEKDIFPALLAAADSPARRAQAFELVSSLLVEHHELAELWHALRIPLLALGSGVAVSLPGGTAADFLQFARRHLERGELELADLMRVIGPQRSREIGVAMAQRHDDTHLRIKDCPLKP
ncbi:MAG: hemerythrin domain-containing protein [Betaproteobacteria bacterium]|nr:hemerythrin domain-containing protein [Betaproteobacteria bacterium]